MSGSGSAGIEVTTDIVATSSEEAIAPMLLGVIGSVPALAWLAAWVLGVPPPPPPLGV